MKMALRAVPSGFVFACACTFSGTFTDPGTQDTYTLVVNWGEGAPQTYHYAAGATTFSQTHQYLDDNPSGTLSDTYAIHVTATDNDGGAANPQQGN